MKILRQFIGLIFLTLYSNATFSMSENSIQKPFVIIVQPIVVEGDDGNNPQPMRTLNTLFDKTVKNTDVDLYFLEPLFYNNAKARDGKMSLEKIINLAQSEGYIRGQGDIVNMFFVNAIDENKVTLANNIKDKNIKFIALNAIKSSSSNAEQFQQKNMDAFVIFDKDEIKALKKKGLVRPRVDILSVEEGRKAILDETFEPYFSKLQTREIETFIQEKVSIAGIENVRDYARKRFQAAVIPFSKTEQSALNYAVSEVNKVLLKNNNHLMANHPWRFIKVDSWLCGGFAHTRGSFIILSQRHLDSLTNIWKKSISNENRIKLLSQFGALLVHEQMHSLQRSFPKKFVTLNTQFWNFKQAKVEPENFITLNQVSNPDAPQAEWLIPNPEEHSEFYWVRTLLKEGVNLPQMGRDFIDKVFTIYVNEGRYNVKKENDNLIIKALDDISFYTNSFPVQRGIDHPNEISAYMFSDVFLEMINKETGKEKAKELTLENKIEFMKWIQLEMNNRLSEK